MPFLSSALVFGLASQPLSGVQSAPTPDPSTLTGKVLFGYQAWHDAKGSGAQANVSWYEGSWAHWKNGGGSGATYPDATNVHPDVWPAMDEYPEEAMITTPGFHDRQTGAEMKLYSAFSQGARDVHFRWMQEYGLDGVFLQRFVHNAACVKGVEPTGNCRRLDHIAETTAISAEKYERVWAMMYDISGGKDDIFNVTKRDWEHLDEELGLTERPGYLHHDGKPVVSVWGFGFTDRGGSMEDAVAFIEWMQARGIYVIGGVPTFWRTEDGDSKEGWLPVYNALDCISPWLSGRFRNTEEFDTGVCPRERCPGTPMFREDKAYTDARGTDYAPVVFPGFSWTNMHHNITSDPSGSDCPRYACPDEGVFNIIPRQKGRFWRHQADWWVRNQSEPLFVYGAMFDEIDEGTSMYKMASSASQLPREGRFVHSSIDGADVPGDFYLSLAGNFTHDWRESRRAAAAAKTVVV